jgi:hypothetical protein
MLDPISRGLSIRIAWPAKATMPNKCICYHIINMLLRHLNLLKNLPSYIKF